jgi:hypothetical protein
VNASAAQGIKPPSQRLDSGGQIAWSLPVHGSIRYILPNPRFWPMMADLEFL